MSENEPRPTLRDVADKAEVHTATASRALNPETASKVNPVTAQRVLRAARALGYRPNPIARSLRTNRSSTVGILIPDLTNPVFPPMIRGADRVLSEHGYSVLLADTDSSAEREDRLHAALRDRQVDGLVIGTALRHHPFLTKVLATDIPVVLINRISPENPALAVIGDEADGIAQSVAHLVELGHRRIAYLAGPQTTSTGSTRLQAFHQALAAHGIDAAPTLITECGAWSQEQGNRGLTRLLDGPEPFSAVMAGNDMLALGCYEVFRKRGIACPEDISLVGFNDMPFIDHFDPALTTVRMPNADIGAEAAKLLLEAIDSGTRSAKVVTIPVRLVVRASTAPA